MSNRSLKEVLSSLSTSTSPSSSSAEVKKIKGNKHWNSPFPFRRQSSVSVNVSVSHSKEKRTAKEHTTTISTSDEKSCDKKSREICDVGSQSQSQSQSQSLVQDMDMNKMNTSPQSCKSCKSEESNFVGEKNIPLNRGKKRKEQERDISMFDKDKDENGENWEDINIDITSENTETEWRVKRQKQNQGDAKDRRPSLGRVVHSLQSLATDVSGKLFPNKRPSSSVAKAKDDTLRTSSSNVSAEVSSLKANCSSKRNTKKKTVTKMQVDQGKENRKNRTNTKMKKNVSGSKVKNFLAKAHNIQKDNRVKIEFLQSLQNKKVKWNHRYSLKTNILSPPKDAPQDNNININNTNHIEDIITVWKYNGKPLIKEKYPRDHFINLTLVGFDDLVRLNDEYSKLLDEYSDVLKDNPKSLAAVEDVLHNLKQLKVAISSVHEQVLSALDSRKIDDMMKSFTTNITKCFQTIRSQLP